jgi:hypothetical protein
MNVSDYIKAIEKINVHEATIKAIGLTTQELADLNREQLAKGNRSDKEKVHWLKDSHYPYTKPYTRIKSKLGLPTDKVDLNLGRKFVDSIKADVKGEQIDFEGTSRLAQYLEPNYSSQIYGLTDENTEIYTENNFQPKFMEEISTQSGIL